MQPSPLPTTPVATVDQSLDSPIWVYGMSVLETEALPIVEGSTDFPDVSAIEELAMELVSAVRNGSGIAAPQIGKSWRMFLFSDALIGNSGFEKVTWSPYQFQVIINPTITEHDGTWECDDESCLSLPGYCKGNLSGEKGFSSLTTERYSTFTLQYDTLEAMEGTSNVQLITGKEFHCPSAPEMLNWVIQHEIDHVDGVLFFEKAVHKMGKENEDFLQKIAAGETEHDYPIMTKEGAKAPSVTA